MPLRFTILHHTAHPTQPDHFDLLFETAPDSLLATFRSPIWPLATATLIEQINDHRREYLEFEGPLSNNRGQVQQVAAGTFEFVQRDESTWILHLSPDQRLTFKRLGVTDQWDVQPSPIRTPTPL